MSSGGGSGAGTGAVVGVDAVVGAVSGAGALRIEAANRSNGVIFMRMDPFKSEDIAAREIVADLALQCTAWAYLPSEGQEEEVTQGMSIIRWKQCLERYEVALGQLTVATRLVASRPLSNLESEV